MDFRVLLTKFRLAQLNDFFLENAGELRFIILRI
jgi:hypothetical protein